MLNIQHVRWFVTGAMNDITFSGAMPSPEYLEKTISVVVRYLQGTQVLDGSCSDIQCSVAHIAEQVFKPNH